MHVVVVSDGSSGSSIFAFDGMIRAIFSSPDAAAKSLANAAVGVVGVWHDEVVIPGLELLSERSQL